MMTTAGSMAWIALLETEVPEGWPSSLPEPTPRNILIGVCILLILIVVAAKLRHIPSNLRARNKSVLDPTQLEALMIGTPPQIVDLRPREAYMGEEGHIRGSMNIPFSEFRNRIEELDTSHPRPIVLVDDTDELSHQVMPLLEARGHRWIYVLKGGFKAWRRSKYPIYTVPADQKRK